MNQSLAVNEFSTALATFAPRFNVALTAAEVERLERYFEILQAWNARLHLVAPCSPEEFAFRHVLESLMAVRHIASAARIVDLGSGGGLPVIPCLIARPDLTATLIESSTKKAVFLREALRATETHVRATVIAERFEKVSGLEADVVTCRALERFSESLAAIAEWAPSESRLLLFGGPKLGAEIERLGLRNTAVRIPESEQRYLFVVEVSPEA
jgi:16S rRNA (guanine527-N7)-methyltransferase